MSVHLTPEVFARLVGATDSDVLLFEVSHPLYAEWYENWSPPVQLHMVKTEGALVSLELRRVDTERLQAVVDIVRALQLPDDYRFRALHAALADLDGEGSEIPPGSGLR